MTHHANARPLGGGIIGLGLAGGIMAPIIAEHPGLTLAGAAETDASTRATFTADTGLPAYAEVCELLANPTVDFVYVATPHQCHRAHAVLAAEHGKHIIVEKPMALSLADCDAMIDAANANGVQLVIGHTHSFDPAIAAIRALIDSGRTGAPVSLAMWNFTDFLYRPRRPEELDSARGGGILYNQLPHQLDVARLIVNSPIRSVRAATTRLDPTRPTEGGCSAFVDFENGACATVVYSGYDRFDSDELHGWIAEGGQLKTARHGHARRMLSKIAGPEGEAAQRRVQFGYGAAGAHGNPPHQPHFGLMLVSCERADIRQSADGLYIYDDAGADEQPIIRSSWRPGRGDVLEELRRAVVDGVPPLHDGTFGRGTVEAAIAIAQSAAARREITITELAAA
ncbi:Gfo/Idh/MocA family oxidoreductase [Sphingomonas sp. MG17]|uniref:Gfo/Idh/MocA family oxidoreductase n=1 Tax=Sphingomonas tagetis TaxID=2949092 RepID=A0A9X2KNV8_9SPHN|nr:Gfo/Idh/MocA family oxidoreductase [Sphingomonas tagetis]MCP3730033.1 Gfo/Idh/MocA family oxidoreductase [Sphingomonas tagetis]